MMARKNRIAATFGLGLMMAFASPALAEDNAPTADNNRLDEAWEDVLETEGEILETAEFAILTNLAYQMAVARVCDTYTLDQDALSQATAELLDGAEKELNEDQLRELQAAILISLGARYGLYVAEGHIDRTAFCGGADDLVKTPDGVTLFLK